MANWQNGDEGSFLSAQGNEAREVYIDEILRYGANEQFDICSWYALQLEIKSQR